MTRLTANHLIRPPHSDYRKVLRGSTQPLDEEIVTLARLAKSAMSDLRYAPLLLAPLATMGDPFDYLAIRKIRINIANMGAGPIFSEHAASEQSPKIIVYSGISPFSQVSSLAPTGGSPYIEVDSSGVIEEAVVLLNVFRYGNLEPMASVVLSQYELQTGFEQQVVTDRIAPFREAKVESSAVSKFVKETGLGLDLGTLLRLLHVRLAVRSLPDVDDTIEQTRVLADRIASSGVVGARKVLQDMSRFGTDRALVNATVFDIASGNVLYRLPREIMQALSGRPSIMRDPALSRCVISLDGKIVGPSANDFSALLGQAEESIALNFCQHLGFVPKSPEVPELITKEDFPRMLSIWRM